MKILFRKPNQPLELMEVESKDNIMLHDLIGGYYEVIDIRPDILCLCDEDGKNKQLAMNYIHNKYGVIVGNVIFCSRNSIDFISLNDEQIDYIVKYMGIPMMQKI